MHRFKYSPESPTGLVWREDRFSGRGLKKLEVLAGSAAGTVAKGGYIKVSIDGKQAYAHRVIWELEVGPIPRGMCIDHIDGNRSNNRLDNLRLVTAKGNARNKAPKGGKARQGVWLYTIRRNGRAYRYWRVSVTDPETGKTAQRDFSLLRLGDGARVAAETYRKSVIEGFNARGAGYTERHGT